MAFNSMQYLMFLPIVFLVFHILPVKIRNVWLLAASYFFYMSWNVKYGLLILAVTLISYVGAILIDKFRDTDHKYDRTILAVVVILEVLLLVYFKYADFLLRNINGVVSALGMKQTFSALEILLPVGISFYIFQALGYVIDVYRKDTEVEKNLFTFALFVSFFPQLVAGPIERSNHLLQQLKDPQKLEADEMRAGLVYILIGIWQKVLVADNIALIVDEVYGNYAEHPGMKIVFVTMLFSIQIYCDFGGYTNIAIGSARLFGIDLMQNFDSPYLAIGIADFWRRWHKSLTLWLRDYVYIPLGGNRKGKLRKYINTLVVFTVSGIWHGAAWKYIFWGFFNGVGIILEDLLPERKRKKEVSTNRNWGNRWIKRGVTFCVVSFGWLFFRADSFRTGIRMIKYAVENMRVMDFVRGRPFMDNRQMAFLLMISVLIMLAAALLRERGHDPVSVILEQQWWVRWCIYLATAFVIILFGVYGGGYEQTRFIYFQF